MSGFLGFLGFGRNISQLPTGGGVGVPEIYPMSLGRDIFVNADIRATYTKILTDCAERMHGLSNKEMATMWDSCVQSDASSGLISLLADAMLRTADLFLVYKSGVIRKATSTEEQQIRSDYNKQASSPVGIYVSFKNFRTTQMLVIYSVFEYCVLSGLHKSVNIAKAVQIKMSEMRSTVSLGDSAQVLAQAEGIANALRSGEDVLIDKDDEITSSTPDITPIEKAITFLDSKRAYYLNYPLAYISGIKVGGLSDTGQADKLAIERGHRLYFVSILQPTVQAIFNKEVEFRSDNFEQMGSALEALKTFDLTSDENLSRKSKQQITARLFDVDPEKEEKQIEAEAREAEKQTAAVSPVVDDAEAVNA